MKEYLANYFRYNDNANIRLLDTIQQLPDATECVRLFSHLINAQNKWYNRVSKQTGDHNMDWSLPLYTGAQLKDEWSGSISKWLSLLAVSSGEQLQEYILFNRQSDHKTIRVKLADIMFQLNCHSVHHRAQINKLISAQGFPVPLTDYIFSVLEEVG